jgi:hypothetical protein
LNPEHTESRILAPILLISPCGDGAMTTMRHPMSSTRDWMRGGGDGQRPARSGLPLGGVVAWALGLVVVANLVLVMARLAG